MHTTHLPVPKLLLPEDINLMYLQLRASETRRLALEETNVLLDSKIKHLQEEVERLKGFLRLARYKAFGAKSVLRDEVAIRSCL
jgi:hypothetical protein